MKSAFCIIWVLTALLLAALLDNQPDPPTVSPKAAICAVQLQNHCGDTVIQGSDLPSISGSCPLSPAGVTHASPVCPVTQSSLSGTRQTPLLLRALVEHNPASNLVELRSGTRAVFGRVLDSIATIFVPAPVSYYGQIAVTTMLDRLDKGVSLENFRSDSCMGQDSQRRAALALHRDYA